MHIHCIWEKRSLWNLSLRHWTKRPSLIGSLTQLLLTLQFTTPKRGRVIYSLDLKMSQKSHEWGTLRRQNIDPRPFITRGCWVMVINDSSWPHKGQNPGVSSSDEKQTFNPKCCWIDASLTLCLCVVKAPSVSVNICQKQSRYLLTSIISYDRTDWSTVQFWNIAAFLSKMMQSSNYL